MPDTTNVIEIDFKPKDERALSEIAADLQASVTRSEGGLAELRELTRSIRADFEWYYDQWRRERARNRRLERELLRERAQSFSFCADDVLEAVRNTYSGVALSAGTVAAEPYGHEPTHSARVRTGHVLSRLARDGRVVRHPPQQAGRPCRWEPVSA